jgi:hypothetical protein
VVVAAVVVGGGGGGGGGRGSERNNTVAGKETFNFVGRCVAVRHAVRNNNKNALRDRKG